MRGKTLGIVGYGNIGTQLSNLAEALGMQVIFYDHTDKLRLAMPSRCPAWMSCGTERRRVVACAGDVGHARDDRRGRSRR